MKQTELRTGNWIEKDGKQYQISALGIFCIGPKHKPIPLTEEWFKKIEGFYKDGKYWSISIYDYKYCFKYREWAENWAFYQEYTDSPFDEDNGKKYPVSFDIKYIHQLQNLYFALTGEELTIK